MSNASTVNIGPILDHGPWTAYQKLVLGLAALAVILDGFDNQVLGIALPLLIKEWGAPRESFSPVFAAGFFGMAFGTFIGGILGDKFGRRSALILSVLTFALFTGSMALTDTVPQLLICRFLAGLGLGGAMPNAAALVAEYTPLKRRSLAVTIGIVCIPLGGVFGGFIAAYILPTMGWRVMFGLGGVLPIAVGLILLMALPESPKFLAQRPDGQLKLRNIMRKLGRSDGADTTYADETHLAPGVRPASVASLLTPDYRRDSIALWVAFFFCMHCIYLVFNWLPTLFASAGFDLSMSSSSIGAFNTGGVIAAITGGWLMGRLGSRVTILSLAAASVVGGIALVLTPLDPASRDLLVVMLAVEGAFVNGAQTTLYALAAQMYPTQVRATGVGATVTWGRIGAIVSSFAGAMLLAGGNASFFGVIALAMAVTFVALALIRRHTPKIVN